jgi:hypothetical protein
MNVEDENQEKKETKEKHTQFKIDKDVHQSAERICKVLFSSFAFLLLEPDGEELLMEYRQSGFSATITKKQKPKIEENEKDDLEVVLDLWDKMTPAEREFTQRLWNTELRNTIDTRRPSKPSGIDETKKEENQEEEKNDEETDKEGEDEEENEEEQEEEEEEEEELDDHTIDWEKVQKTCNIWYHLKQYPMQYIPCMVRMIRLRQELNMSRFSLVPHASSWIPRCITVDTRILWSIADLVKKSLSCNAPQENRKRKRESESEHKTDPIISMKQKYLMETCGMPKSLSADKRPTNLDLIWHELFSVRLKRKKAQFDFAAQAMTDGYRFGLSLPSENEKNKGQGDASDNGH